jgi:hypothetical protein
MTAIQEANSVTEHQENAEWNVADWHGKMHHYELNYTPPDTESGRRLARR